MQIGAKPVLQGGEDVNATSFARLAIAHNC